MSSQDDQALVIQDLYSAPCPKELEQTWRAFLNRSRSSDAMKRAVYRGAILQEPWREASRAEGISHPQPFKAARRHGLAGLTQEQFTHKLTRIANLATDQLEEALIEGSLKPSEVSVLTGIVTDKLTKIWDRRTGENAGYSSFLDHLARQLEHGGTVSFQMSVIPGDSAVDVTPHQSE